MNITVNDDNRICVDDNVSTVYHTVIMLAKSEGLSLTRWQTANNIVPSGFRLMKIQHKVPTIAQCARLSKALGISRDELVAVINKEATCLDDDYCYFKDYSE